MDLKVRVLRYDPLMDDEPRFVEYSVPYQQYMTVLDVLQYIYENYDSTLSFKWGCRAGQCGSCTVVYNEKPSLACRTKIDPEQDVEISPLPYFPIVKDLVVNTEKIREKLIRALPFLESMKKIERPYKVKQEEIESIVDLRKCIECYSCVATCPVIDQAWQDYGSPFVMREVGRWAFDKRDSLDRIKIAMLNGLYNCTTCGSCKEVCYKNIDIPEKAIEKLRNLAVIEGLAPLPPHKTLIASIQNYWNPWLQPRAARAKWAKKMKLKDEGDTLFFAGCSPSLLLKNLPLSSMEILNSLNKDVAYLGRNERCCGSPLLRLGDLELFDEIGRSNIEEFKKAGAERIIVTCAGCYKALKVDYPNFFGDFDFEVKHISEVIADEIREGNVDFKEKYDMKVTYHDPCHLGRAGGVYDAPREIIKAIPGLELIEMNRKREISACCGSGGGLKTYKPDLAMSIGGKRVEMAKNTGAEYILTCCPWCEQNLDDSAKKANIDMKTIDLVDIVVEVLEV
ncbi:MAG: fumarate reductase (CoM/CoB) subunit TfrB [Candidatus Hydrothermarchaeota archaeon]